MRNGELGAALLACQNHHCRFQEEGGRGWRSPLPRPGGGGHWLVHISREPTGVAEDFVFLGECGELTSTPALPQVPAFGCNARATQGWLPGRRRLLREHRGSGPCNDVPPSPLQASPVPTQPRLVLPAGSWPLAQQRTRQAVKVTPSTPQYPGAWLMYHRALTGQPPSPGHCPMLLTCSLLCPQGSRQCLMCSRC